MMHSKAGALPLQGGALPTENLADDMLRGADQIAGFLLGDPKERRKIYHLSETSRLPVFRLGAVLCARKSVLLAWIAQQEENAIKGVANG